MTNLDIPGFLKRKPGAPRTAPAAGRERVWLTGSPPKPPFKKQIKALVFLGWSRTQAMAMSRKDADIAIALKSPPTARFMTDLWKDGGDGKPKS